MTWWRRLRAIVSGRIDRALDDIDDPVAALDRAYATQAEVLRRARESIVEVLTSEKRLQIEVASMASSERRSREDAEVALARGDESSARTALGRATAARYGRESLQQHVDELRAERLSLEAAVETLRARVESFRVAKIAMQARHTASRAGSRIGEALTGLSGDGAEVEQIVERARDAAVSLRARSDALLDLSSRNALDPPGVLGNDASESRVRAAAIAHDVDIALREMQQRAALPGDRSPT